MPRLSYGAPGVYVEEVPSARQAIAGVGTNTAAFIGFVPDRIYCPVPNAGYNPVTARVKLAVEGRMPEGQTPEQANQERNRDPKPECEAAPAAQGGDEAQRKLDATGEPAPDDS
jgi:hypothetical protein